NNLSPLPEALDGRKRPVVNGCTSSLEYNVLGISEWQGRSLLKRKFSDLCCGDPDSSEEASSASSSNSNSGESPNKDTVIFKAKCGDDLIAFHLPVSSVTFVALKKLIDESFGINESFRIQYFGNCNNWVVLDDDGDLKVCLLRRNVNKSSTHIRLLLVRGLPNYFQSNAKWRTEIL
ncbi:hypothetical protein Tco_1287729, partial [Tanacetum coccineum]